MSSEDTRRRGKSISLFNKMSTMGSNGGGESSLRKEVIVADMNQASLAGPPPAASFEYYNMLPIELQFHILSFLPSRTLHKTMARVNHFHKELIESQTQRRILDMMHPTAGAYKGDHHANVLIFEAQRPIDTITSKHVLYFSHFSRTDATSLEGGSSVMANFSFTPPERRKDGGVRSESVDSMRSSASSTSPLFAQYRNIHANDISRLTQRTVTSSMAIPGQMNPVGRARAPSSPRQPFTDVSGPIGYRDMNNVGTRLVEDDDNSGSRQDGIARGRAHEGYEGFQVSSPQLVGSWAEPIASSTMAFDDRRSLSRGASSREGRSNRGKPTYRFGLDPLDSFETWILSLTLQRRSKIGPSGRPLRWEKKVAEGLDRVFRDWFNQGEDPAVSSSYQEQDSALQRASLIAELSSSRHSSSLPTTAVDHSFAPTEKVRQMDAQEEQDQALPAVRLLEFDESCSVIVQPHASAWSNTLHPALTSLSSHHYLSTSSLSSSTASLLSRVDFTFHCDALCINAARLLNALEDVEHDIQRASNQARQRGARIVAGSSGTTAWAYSTGMNQLIDNDSARWAPTQPSDGGVAVLVFGAARD